MLMKNTSSHVTIVVSGQNCSKVIGRGANDLWEWNVPFFFSCLAVSVLGLLIFYFSWFHKSPFPGWIVLHIRIVNRKLSLSRKDKSGTIYMFTIGILWREIRSVVFKIVRMRFKHIDIIPILCSSFPPLKFLGEIGVFLWNSVLFFQNRHIPKTFVDVYSVSLSDYLDWETRP